MNVEEARDLCDDVRLIVDDDLVGLTKSERRKIKALLTAYEAQSAELKDLYSEILAGSGIEPFDEDGRENRTWIVPAEPEPCVCDSLSEALTTFGLLRDEEDPDASEEEVDEPNHIVCTCHRETVAIGSGSYKYVTPDPFCMVCFPDLSPSDSSVEIG